MRLRGRLSCSGIAELGAGGLLGSEGGLRAGRDQRALLLSQSSLQMHHERIRVGAELRDDERNLVHHRRG
jgi:hypothetical protein